MAFTIDTIWAVYTQLHEDDSCGEFLGLYTGHIDEIALHLDKRKLFTLVFKPVNIVDSSTLRPTSTTTDVVIGDSLSSHSSILHAKDLLAGRPVRFGLGKMHNSVYIVAGKDQEDYDKLKKRLAVDSAMKKLDETERIALKAFFAGELDE